MSRPYFSYPALHRLAPQVRDEDLRRAHTSATRLISEIDRAEAEGKRRNITIVVSIYVKSSLWSMCTRDVTGDRWGRIPPQLLVPGSEALLVGAEVESCYRRKGISGFSSTFALGSCCVCIT